MNIMKKIIEQSEKREIFQMEIVNDTKEDIWLKDVLMFHADSLSELGLKEDNCRLFRSGRHKNDMPSVCTFGIMDESMKDTLSQMTESGDQKEEDRHKRVIVSDHLTILGGEADYVLLGFLTGQNHLFRTEINIDERGGFVSLDVFAEFRIRLTLDKHIFTEELMIEHISNPEKAIDEFARMKAERFGSRNKNNMAVFCTWYYYGLTVTYEDVQANLNWMREHRLPFDVFQVDEGWEVTLGEWEPNGKFPVSMKQVADEIKEAGYIPGIWTSPFVAKETATVWKEHPEWILYRQSGEPALFYMNDTTYYIFDITNAETWKYFEGLYRKLTFEWGYRYHKLDFTRAAVIVEDGVYFDDTITLAQAYTQAVKAIRRGMGEESYFLMCGGLYDPLIGIVDAQRTGSDVLSMWSSNINKDGKTAPYTIKQSLLRYYMNRWWNNDPDALMVRINPKMERGLRLTYGLLNDEEVKTVVLNQLTGGGIVCSTEPLEKIAPERLYQLRHILPIIPLYCVPINIMDCGRFPACVRLTLNKRDSRNSNRYRTGENSVYYVFINWSDTEEMKLELPITEQLLTSDMDCNGKFAVSEFYGREFVTDLTLGHKIGFKPLKPHASTIIKITQQTGEPVVVASDGHFLMGAELEKLSVTDGKLKISGNNSFPVPINYTVLMPDGKIENRII
ncbi:MAG: alpha-galactosidase [Eubacteriales bacterium]|nr:alpha-galactosidase [Eubacteriales bacterium]